jgi:hypothetical protein
MRIFWKTAQTLSVATALFLVALLWISPRNGLFITWNVLIPIVPAALIVFPRVWRNVCPVAVVSQLPALLFPENPPRRIPANMKWGGTLVAIALFLIIVPTRLTLLNHSGAALAVFVLAVVVVALVTGAIYSGKSGWCATICPVHVVEEIYGQYPLLDMPHAHCTTCTACVNSCPDLNSTRSFNKLTTPVTTSPERSESSTAIALLRTPLGIFALAFPGFILGYFTAGDNYSLVAAYLWIFLWCVVSLLVFAALYLLLRYRRKLLFLVSAATALFLYYWFSVPAVALAASKEFGIGSTPDSIINLVRAGIVLLIGIWLAQAVRSDAHKAVLQ